MTPAVGGGVVTGGGGGVVGVVPAPKSASRAAWNVGAMTTLPWVARITR